METAIIMGAGPAGLTAAYELLAKTAIRPVIIEAEDQVGGLSKTISFKGNLIDIGGHRFFSKSEKIMDWWLGFLPLKKEDQEKALSLSYQNQSSLLRPFSGNQEPAAGNMLIRPRKSRIYFNRKFFDYPLSLKGQTIRNFGMLKLTRIGLSYLKAKCFPVKNETNLEEFFINRFGKELYLTFFKGYTEKIWGSTCREIPADWGHQRIKDLNIGRAISQSFTSLFSKNESLTQKNTSTSLIEQFLYPEKGPGQMWETVAQKIISLGGEIHFGCRVEKIHVENNHRIQYVTCLETGSGNSKEIKGDYFFSTIPVQQLIGSMQNIQVPDEIGRIAAGLQYRDFIMVGLLFKKQPGSADGLTDNWIYLQDKELIAGRMQIFNNWSPHMVRDENTLWIGMEYFCLQTDPIWKLESADMIRLALNEISGTGLISKADFLDGTVIRVPKAYPSYHGSYQEFPKVQEYLDGFENLFLIGRNGMHRYNNADHSMMTAITAVENIVTHQRSRANIWEVNMEKDFHEEKGS